MAVELGTGYVSLVPETKGFASAAQGQMAAPMMGAGGKIGGIFATAMKVAPLLAIAFIGKQALDFAGEMDKAYDTIRVGTGATGEALEGLKGDFKDVFGDIPTTAGEAGQAIADINTRLGLTGDPLQNVSKQMLELSRITGTDLTTNLESATRTFGDWGIAQGDMSGTMDKLFRTAQLTGISFGDLNTQMVQYGAPLRELGYSFEESAAMLAKFEKEGVNAELVLGGLKMGLGRLAREGRNPREEMDALQKSIQEAGLTAENKAAVFEIFGARAGIDMAKAMEEGRFALGDLVGQIEGGSDTILAAAGDTMSMGESWQMVKNNLGLLIEGPASAAFKWISDTAGAIVPLIQGIKDGSVSFGKFGIVLESMGAVAKVVWDALQPFIESIKQAFSEMMVSVAPAIERFKEAFENLKPVFMLVGSVIAAVLAVVMGVVLGVFNGIARAIGPLIDAFAALFDFFGHIVGAVVALFSGDLEGAWEHVKGAFQAGLDFFASIFEAIYQLVAGFVEGIVDWFVSLWDQLVGHSIIPDMVNGILEWFTNLMDQGVQLFADLATKIVETMLALMDIVIEAAGQLVSGIVERLDDLLPGFRDKFDAVVKFLKDFVSQFVDVGKAIANGIKDGISAVWSGLVSKLKRLVALLPQSVKDLLGIHSPSVVFARIGGNIAEGLAVGIEDGQRRVVGAVDMLSGYGASGSYALSAAGGGMTFNGPIHVNVPDGRVSTFKRELGLEVARTRDRGRTAQL